MRVARKKLAIPERVSGRLVTNRGVHLQPFGHHGGWLNRASYWTDLLVSMGMSWAVIITDGDSVRQQQYGLNPLEVLLDSGIIPIIRDMRQFPSHFTEQDTVLWTVDLYGKYGLKPFWIIRNEPFDDREWKKGTVPADAWHTVMSVWAQAARFIASNGGYAGFPDGPGYSSNPFESLRDYGCQWIFDEGLGFYAGHHYGKGRHRDYPYDAVTRHGANLTEEAYRRLLDDWADDPRWREESIDLMNQRRNEGQNPALTPGQDDTCWRGWEKVAGWSLQTFGYVVPMALTEGGWVPRDRPGTGLNTDIRKPHTTPRMVAKKTLQMYDAPSPFFSICPWLLACEDMGGSGWPYDAWHGWAYADKYGSKKPVITALESTPPKELKARTEPLIMDVEGDTRTWAWARTTYGTRYRRGQGPLRLIEIHEYEGPATFDILVVDGDGLPVEGVPFCYYYPGAPVLPARAGAAAEWLSRCIVRLTGVDGRISFSAEGGPCTADNCRESIWPQGRGDLLWRVGMLSGTRNRHLNGVWQLVEMQPQAKAQLSLAAKAPTSRWDQILEKLERIEDLVGRLPTAGKSK